MDRIYELPYARVPHPSYGKAKIPAYEMIRFSVTIQRGCFGGCTFCSITEHEGRIIQNRSEESILREIETIRDDVPGFTGVISDLGGPTANMYRLACKSREIESACRRPSCVYPAVCPNLNTNHAPLIHLYRKARELPGIKKVLIASGVRYDLAIESPEYVKELAQHHTGGYLKIAPEAIGEGPLSKMMKPGVGTYYKFKQLFDRFSQAAGKEQYLIPYFIAAHPGTTDEDMLELALWLKKNGYRADQVQAFLPGPMATATAMYHSGKNPLRRVTRDSEAVTIPQGLKVRRLHKAFLRYHDPNNWPMLRAALKRMRREDLIGNGKQQLVPRFQPKGTGKRSSRRPRAAPARAGRSAPSTSARSATQERLDRDIFFLVTVTDSTPRLDTRPHVVALARAAGARLSQRTGARELHRGISHVDQEDRSRQRGRRGSSRAVSIADPRSSSQGPTAVLEEIIVSARRREEGLQTVPLAITAFTGESLEARGIDMVGSMNAMAPNLSVQGGSGREIESSASFRVRGVPGVAVYVDGIDQTNAIGLFTMGVVEVDRIEVLRGPQGTLFGNSALGGAVQYVTRRPAEDSAAACKFAREPSTAVICKRASTCRSANECAPSSRWPT